MRENQMIFTQFIKKNQAANLQMFTKGVPRLITGLLTEATALNISFEINNTFFHEAK